MALYFAVVEDGPSPRRKTNGCVWALEPALLNDKHGWSGGILVPARGGIVGKMIHDAFEPAKEKTLPPVVAVAAFESDIRMLVQQSTFTIHSNRDDLSTSEHAATVLRKYIVPKDSKGYLRERLRTFGISASTVFPDLESLAKDIRSSYGG